MTADDLSSTRSFTQSERGDEPYDVVVIGGGQAGLTLGYYLRQAGLRFAILERGDRIGGAWAERWDSLVLFTPRRYNAMPGLPLEGDADSEPARDEVRAYLERYAHRLALPVELRSEVRRLWRHDGRYRLEVDGGTMAADQVVVATGPFQRPKTPDFASELVSEVFQIHAVDYRRPGDVPAGTVVVVGGGNTGYQIAEELAATHRVHLAVGSRQTPLPSRLLGRHIFWWLTKLGYFNLTVDSRLGRRMSQRDALIGSSPRKARRRGIVLEPRVVGAAGRSLRLADGRSLEPDAVVWATGYQSDYAWIEVPVLDQQGRPRQRRGVTDGPGLYFLGLTWQWTRGSALLGFVREDAEYLSRLISRRVRI